MIKTDTMANVFKVTCTIITFFISVISYGETYTTTTSGGWTPALVGASGGSNGYTGSDTFIIKHPVTLNGFVLENGGSVVIEDGGELSFGWSLTINEGATLVVGLGGILKCENIKIDNSGTLTINGTLTSLNGGVDNKLTGKLFFNKGGIWDVESFDIENEGQMFIYEDVDWEGGQLVNNGSIMIESTMTVLEMNIQNYGVLNGSGQINMGEGKSGNVNVSVVNDTGGSINGCLGNGCIPERQEGNVIYLGKGGEQPCGVDYIVTNDEKIDTDKAIGILNVNSGVILTIGAEKTVTICDKIINNGTIIIQNKASIVQTETSLQNEGNGVYIMNRKVTDSDKVYHTWSSPFKNLSIEEAFPTVNKCDVLAFDVIDQDWKYDYSISNPINCVGEEVVLTSESVTEGADGVMDVGRGYFVPGQAGLVRVSGEINNGDIITPVFATNIKRDNWRWSDNDWNLIGNPYPCAIDLKEFYEENKDVIQGAFYYWVDNKLGASSYNESNEYAVYTIGEAATESNNKMASQYVPSGQAFWVWAMEKDVNDDAGVVAGNGIVKFTNAMRAGGTNQDLYKKPIGEAVYVYLDVVNDLNNYNQCAIGYNETSTDGVDKDSDAYKADLGSAIFLAAVLHKLSFNSSDSLSKRCNFIYLIRSTATGESAATVTLFT